MVTHTPGPWEAVTGGLDALVRCPDGRTFNIGDAIYHGQESKANANLIAAAPDLLGALEDMVKATDNWNAAVQDIIGRQPHTGIDLENARVAIAKARGES